LIFIGFLLLSGFAGDHVFNPIDPAIQYHIEFGNTEIDQSAIPIPIDMERPPIVVLGISNGKFAF
jgi:hypothetical protein